GKFAHGFLELKLFFIKLEVHEPSRPAGLFSPLKIRTQWTYARKLLPVRKRSSNTRVAFLREPSCDHRDPSCECFLSAPSRLLEKALHEVSRRSHEGSRRKTRGNDETLENLVGKQPSPWSQADRCIRS